MRQHSQIANVIATHHFRKSGEDLSKALSHTANMADTEEKNGGPNHLGAWMRYRNITGAQLAKEVDTTPGVISDLVNSNRQLGAKWLRRLAAPLRTTAGMLLDHDPYDLDADLIEIWVTASVDQRKTLSDVAKAVVKSPEPQREGTNG